MAGLRLTTRDLSRLGRRWRQVMASTSAATAGAAHLEDPRLVRVPRFSSNPGQLEMLVYAPETLPSDPALVVVLHGCTQSAADYAVGSGWLTLADRYGFVVLCPQQTASNNPKRCFNWYAPGDTTRGEGEVLSIRQMVERAVTDYGIDRTRIFVAGLSAGGAMAAALLATYPETFAAGAVVAGLPYRVAGNVQEALHAMFQVGSRPAEELGDLVRAASPHHGPWPRLSIWHGDQDKVVGPGNAAELVKQWTDVHGLPAAPTWREVVDGHVREVWRNGAGEEMIESFTIAGMGHGAALAVGAEDAMCGAAGPFLLDVGISSAYRTAAFWGLTKTGWLGAARRTPTRSVPALAALETSGSGPESAGSRPQPARPSGRDPDDILPPFKARTGSGATLPIDIGATITSALKAAGLMRR